MQRRTMRRPSWLLALVALLLAGLACSTSPPTETPTAPPETPTATQPAQTPTASPTPIAPTQTPNPEWVDNPIPNGDFDAELPVDKNQPGTYMNIFEGVTTSYNPLALAGGWLHRGWSPLYCNTPYAPERCQGVQTILVEDGSVRHIANTSMDYPEYKDGVGENRVVDGTNSQQLFRPFAPFRAGIWQEVDVPQNSTCEITALVQSWSATEWVEGALSNFPNPDAFNQSAWRIGMKEDRGPIYLINDQGHVVYGWFQYGPWQIWHALDATDVQASEWYTGVPSRAYQLDHGMAVQPTHYDEFQLISATVNTGNNSKVTVFVENMTLFGFRYTDRYIESVSMRCRDTVEEPTPTPTPTPSPTPTEEPFPTPTPIYEGDPRVGTLVYDVPTVVRVCPTENISLGWLANLFPTRDCPILIDNVGQEVLIDFHNAVRVQEFELDSGGLNLWAQISIGEEGVWVAAMCFNGGTRARFYPHQFFEDADEAMGEPYLICP